MVDRIAQAGPVLALIRRYESEAAAEAQGVDSAYDVVWSKIAAKDRPKKLTALTVARVLWWQDLIDPLYLSEAAGAYQIMEDTLRTLAVDPTALFDRATQDALGLQLLDRRGWARCQAGAISAEEFADQLAREWASLPVVRDQRGSSRTVRRGQSYYAGDGLNAASAKPEEVLSAIHAALQGAPATEVPVAGANREDATVAWLRAAPLNSRRVGEWLVAAPQGVMS